MEFDILHYMKNILVPSALNGFVRGLPEWSFGVFSRTYNQFLSRPAHDNGFYTIFSNLTMHKQRFWSGFLCRVRKNILVDAGGMLLQYG